MLEINQIHKGLSLIIPLYDVPHSHKGKGTISTKCNITVAIYHIDGNK